MRSQIRGRKYEGARRYNTYSKQNKENSISQHPYLVSHVKTDGERRRSFEFLGQMRQVGQTAFHGRRILRRDNGLHRTNPLAEADATRFGTDNAISTGIDQTISIHSMPNLEKELKTPQPASSNHMFRRVVVD